MAPSAGKEGAGLRLPALTLLYVITFAASACVMIVELAAARVIARHVGYSLFTWTTIIGIVLGALALGNIVGGWLATRAGVRVGTPLSGALHGSAAFVAAAPWLHWSMFDTSIRESVGFTASLLFGVVATFGVPALILGMITPMAAAAVIGRSTRVGLSVGFLYAVGSLGAITGTFAAGFVLIPAMGTTVVLLGVALLLSAFGLAVRWSRWSLAALVTVALMVVVASMNVRWLVLGPEFAGREQGSVVYFDESAYQSISVFRDPSGRLSFVFDDLIHGYFDPADPTGLQYDYLRMMRAVIEDRAAVQGYEAAAVWPRSSLMIGGGAYSLPRWFSAAYPGSPLLVLEIDPAVTEAAVSVGAWRPDANATVVHQDARVALRAPDVMLHTFDVVVLDAFRDIAVPFHLTTVEYYSGLARRLSPAGLLVLHVIDTLDSGLFLGSTVRTLRHVFPFVEVLAPDAPDALSGYRATYVIVGSSTPIASRSLYARLRAEVETAVLFPRRTVDVLAGRPGTAVLWDDFAPVDWMLLSSARY